MVCSPRCRRHHHCCRCTATVEALLPCCLHPSASPAAAVPLHCCHLPHSAANFVVMPPLPLHRCRLRATVATPLPCWCCHSAATNTTLLLPRCHHHSVAAANPLLLLTLPYSRHAAAAALPPPLHCRHHPCADTAVAMLLPPPSLCCSHCHRCPATLPPCSLLLLSCRCAPTNNALLLPRCRR